MKILGNADICADGNVLIKTSYSKEKNEYLKSLGYYYSRNHKGHIKKLSRSEIFFLETSGVTKSTKLKQAISKYDNEITALACHHDSKGEDVEHVDLIIDSLPSQKVTLKFIRATQGRCIVGHEWGAGKLLPTLIYAYETEEDTLIVCDPSFINHVENEIKRFFFDGEEFLKRVTIRGFDQINDVCDSKFGVVIIDESHKFQDLQSRRFKNASKLSKNSKSLILITGNNIARWPIGFYSQLKLLGIDITKEKYIKRFFDFTFEGGRLIPGKLNETALRSFIALFYIRKKLSDVWGKGTARVEKRIITPSKEELAFYDRFLENIDPIFSSKTIININKFLTMMKLRQVPKLTESILSGDPDTRIAIVSQFSDAYPKLKDIFGNIISSYGEGREKDSQILFVDSSIYKESFTIIDRQVVIILDSFATKVNDIQLKRRFYRIGLEHEVVFIHLTFELMDMEILNMPEFSNHLKMNQYLEGKLHKKNKKVA